MAEAGIDKVKEEQDKKQDTTVINMLDIPWVMEIQPSV